MFVNAKGVIVIRKHTEIVKLLTEYKQNKAIIEIKKGEIEVLKKLPSTLVSHDDIIDTMTLKAKIISDMPSGSLDVHNSKTENAALEYRDETKKINNKHLLNKLALIKELERKMFVAEQCVKCADTLLKTLTDLESLIVIRFYIDGLTMSEIEDNMPTWSRRLGTSQLNVLKNKALKIMERCL